MLFFSHCELWLALIWLSKPTVLLNCNEASLTELYPSKWHIPHPGLCCNASYIGQTSAAVGQHLSVVRKAVVWPQAQGSDCPLCWALLWPHLEFLGLHLQSDVEL